MKITPKSPELIQSQVAEFKRIGEISQREASVLGMHIGEVASGPVVDFDTRDDLVQIEKDKYLNFIKSGGQERKKRLSFHEEQLKNWDKFSEDVATLFADVDSIDDQQKHPSFLGHGSTHSAFKFEKDGKQYVARRASNKKGDLVAASHVYIAPFVTGNKIDHLQHLVAADPNSDTIITELLPGKNASELTFEEKLAIPEKQIIELIETVRQMNAAGLILDPRETNLMYDTEKGFSILDYQLQDGRLKKVLSFEQNVMQLTPILAIMQNRYSKDGPKVGTAEYEQKAIDLDVKRAALGNKFLDILEQHYPEVIEDAKRRQKEIDESNTKSGDVFISTRDLHSDNSEIRDFANRVEGLGLTSKKAIMNTWYQPSVETTDSHFV